MNEQQTAELIDLIALSWPSKWTAHPNQAMQVKWWARALASVTVDEATSVLLSMIADGAVFPPDLPAIVAAVTDARLKAQGISVPDVDEALAEVTAAVRRFGSRAMPGSWSHDAVGDAVAAVSWASLCNGGDTVRAHFIRAYTAAATRAVKQARAGSGFPAIGTGV